MNDLYLALGLEVLACLLLIRINSKLVVGLLKVSVFAVIIAASFQIYLYFTEILDPFFMIAFVVHLSILIVGGSVVLFLKYIYAKSRIS